MQRGLVSSWNRKLGPCDLCGMPCVGAKGLGRPRENGSCGPREELVVRREGDCEACIGEERTGYISCVVALERLLSEGSVQG